MLPPLVGAATSRLETFRVMLPGLWLMAASPLALVLLPDVAGACLWQAREKSKLVRVLVLVLALARSCSDLRVIAASRAACAPRGVRASPSSFAYRSSDDDGARAAAARRSVVRVSRVWARPPRRPSLGRPNGGGR